jgi:hypothetical protein
MKMFHLFLKMLFLSKNRAVFLAYPVFNSSDFYLGDVHL